MRRKHLRRASASREGELTAAGEVREVSLASWPRSVPIAEPRAPLWVAFKGLELGTPNFVSESFDEVVGTERPRLSDVDPLVREIFTRVGR
jgi:hypothetical protein